MRGQLTFVDQTLGYALNQGWISVAEVLELKPKIAALSPMLFDLPSTVLESGLTHSAVEGRDVRLEMEPDPVRLKKGLRWGCRWVKLRLEPGWGSRWQSAGLEKFMACAAQHGIRIALQGIDLGRDSIRDLLFFKEWLRRCPEATLVIADPRSFLEPLATDGILGSFREAGFGELEYCGNNQLGLATGSALAAVRNGIGLVDVAIGGLGDFPAWEEVVMALRYLWKMPLELPPNLAVECCGILSALGVTPSPAKPILGANIFAHESGIHVDGVLKNSELYEPFAPEAVGLARQIVIGKHSGKAALELKLKELNVAVENLDLARMLERVRQMAIGQKAPLQDGQLRELAEEVG